jgi:MFS family permease
LPAANIFAFWLPMNVPNSASIESRYGWWVAIASTLMIATAFGSTYLVVVGLKPIAAEFGWPRQIPSAGYSAALFGAGVGGILMGLWSDRKGMLGPAMCGAVFVGLGVLAISQSYSAITFLGAHLLLLGVLGNGAMFSPLLTNVTHWFDRRMGMAVAVVSSGQSLAGAIWPPVFGHFIEVYGWRGTMVGYALFSFAVLIPLSLVMRRPSPRMLRGGAAADKAARAAMAGGGGELVLGLPANRVFAMLCVAIVGCCVAMSMPMVHIVAYCSDLGFAAARGTEMLSILLFSAFLSRIAYGWLADRIGGLRTLLMGSALQLLGLACFMYVDTLEGLYMVSVFYGVGYGGIVPMYAIIIRELFHDSQAGWRIGVIFLFGTSGMAMGGYIGGLIYDLTATYSLAFLTGIGFNLINLVLVSFMVLRRGGPKIRRGQLVPVAA